MCACRLRLPCSPQRAGIFRSLALTVLAAASACAQALIELPMQGDLPPPPGRLPIFYPPLPPIPGEGIDRLGALQQPGWDAPAELAEIVGEPFYPQLGSLLTEDRISSKQRARLATYLERRHAPIDNLRRALAASSPSLPAEAQAVEVEDAAEELRTFLALAEFAWGRHRVWRVDEADAEITAEARRFREFQYLRAAGYYTEGLAPAQRRLLADYVAQLARTARAATDLPAPKAESGGVLGFLPEGAWIRVPINTPAALLARLDTFAEAKHALQREIVTLLLREDGERPAHRREALEDLARRQAPHVSALHQVAESLRVALAALPPASTEKLPARVTLLSAELQSARAGVQDDLARQLRETRAKLCRYKPGLEDLVWNPTFLPSSTILINGITQRVGYGVMGVVAETPLQSQRASAQRAALQAVTERFTRGATARQAKIERLRSEIFAAAFQAVFPQRTEGAVSAEEMARVTQLLRAEEIASRLPRYADYNTATLHPGLAPAQRRLLLAAALRDLALPLPTGVRRPVFLYDAP